MYRRPAYPVSVHLRGDALMMRAAGVRLSRHLTPEQLRELGAAMLENAGALRAMREGETAEGLRDAA